MNRLQNRISITLFSLLAISTPAWLGAQTVNEQTTRTVAIDVSFEGVSAQATTEIVYTRNDKPSVAVITGPKEIVDGMSWETDSRGVLIFHRPQNNRKTQGHVKIRLNGGDIGTFEATSAGELTVTTNVTASNPISVSASSMGKVSFQKEISAGNQNMNVAVTSNGDIRFEKQVNVDDVNFAVASNGIMKAGIMKADQLRVAASSVGIVAIDNLTTNNTSVSVASGGEVSINRCNTSVLNASAASGGEIIIKNLDAINFNMAAASGGTATIKGKTKYASLSAASGGYVNLTGLNITDHTTKKTSSGGSINF